MTVQVQHRVVSLKITYRVKEETVILRVPRVADRTKVAKPRSKR